MRNYVAHAIWQNTPPTPSWLGRVTILWADTDLIVDCHGASPTTAGQIIAAALHRVLTQNGLTATLLKRNGAIRGVTWA